MREKSAIKTEKKMIKTELIEAACEVGFLNEMTVGER